MQEDRRAWLNRLLEASARAEEGLRALEDPYHEFLLDDLHDLRVRLESELQEGEEDG